MSVDYTIMNTEKKVVLDLGRVGYWLVDGLPWNDDPRERGYVPAEEFFTPEELAVFDEDWGEVCLNPVIPVTLDLIEDAQIRKADWFDRHPSEFAHCDPEKVLNGESWPWLGIRNFIADFPGDRIALFSDGADNFWIWRTRLHRPREGWREFTVYGAGSENPKGYAPVRALY